MTAMRNPQLASRPGDEAAGIRSSLPDERVEAGVTASCSCSLSRLVTVVSRQPSIWTSKRLGVEVSE